MEIKERFLLNIWLPTHFSKIIIVLKNYRNGNQDYCSGKDINKKKETKKQALGKDLIKTFYVSNPTTKDSQKCSSVEL